MKADPYIDAVYQHKLRCLAHYVMELPGDRRGEFVRRLEERHGKKLVDRLRKIVKEERTA